MDIDPVPLLKHVAAQIVDAVNMVGMRMGIDDGVDALNRLAAIRSTRAAVRMRRFFGFAGSQLPQSPVMRGVPGDEPQPRTVKRSRSPMPQPAAMSGRGILVNSRKKFLVVMSAISASLTPTVSASTLAVLAT